MGLRARAPRATASALILALAIGAAGTTGLSSAISWFRPVAVTDAGPRAIAVRPDGAAVAFRLLAAAGVVDATTRPVPRLHANPPPTDAIPPGLGAPSERLVLALLVGFAIGLAAAALFLLPRPGLGRGG